MKILLWGLGAVGYSFACKLKENGYIDSFSFCCVDSSDDAYERFISLGGLADYFVKAIITKDNFKELLLVLDKGDCLLDFSTDVKNLEILEYCLEHGIHYLTTADSSWKGDRSFLGCHQHYQEYLRLKEKYENEKHATCMMEFGMNPGLVSSFAKLCLKEIVNNDDSLYVRVHRKKLKKLLDNGEYGLVAKKLKVTDVQEVDTDDQVTDIPYEEGVLYSTWNCWAYMCETVSVPEIAFGNKKRFYQYKEVFDADISDLFLSLPNPGFEYPEVSITPNGVCKGHVSTHEEIFTIRRLFTYGKYMPTVHFLYSPCEYAIKSVAQFKCCPASKFHLLTKDEIVNGGESVGIVIQGKRFKTRYYGNRLDTSELDETATILQVSASAYAAFEYMMKHPDDGIVLPEDVDENEVLETARRYLKEYVSFPCDKVKITLGK